ncbi:MAG: cohesin domain-containing protein [bacterium]
MSTRQKILGMLVLGGLCWDYVIENGGDKGVLITNSINDPYLAADIPGDLICWHQPGSLTAISNITSVEVLSGTGTKIRVIPEKTYTKKNGTFSVDVMVNDVSGLDLADFYLLFNQSKLALIGIPIQGTIWTGSVFFEVDTSTISLGYIKVTGAKFDNSFTGTGTLIEKAIFQSLVDDPTSIIDIGTATLQNIEAGKIPSTSYCGYIYPYNLANFDLLYPIDVIAGRPWTITITAKNQANELVSDYKGPISISSSLGTINSTTGSFTNGISISTITRYQVGTMTIMVNDSQANVSKSTDPIAVRYACDFGRQGTTSSDEKIDIYDLLLFIKYWRTKDLNGDIGGQNQEGDPPYIISQPDGKVDMWDLMLFVKMWRWSNRQKDLSMNYSTPRLFIDPPMIEVDKRSNFKVDVRIENSVGIIGDKINITYDLKKLNLVSVKEGTCLTDCFSYETKEGLITIDGYGGDIEQGAKDGAIATLEFIALTDDETSISISESYLLNNEGKINAYTIENANVSPCGPSYSALFQSIPNPAKSGVWIPYQLSQGGDTKIVIYNIVGQVVKNIDLGYKEKKYYKKLEEGSAAYWNMKNNNGEIVSNGLYFYKLSSGKFSDIKTLAISK